MFMISLKCTRRILEVYRRLALIRRWEELYGSEPTYLKIIQGLELLGRRDHTEFLAVSIPTVLPDKFFNCSYKGII